MPIITYKNKLKFKNYEQNICISFDCIYDKNNHLCIKDYKPSYFDSGDFRIKTDEAIKNFSNKTLEKYEKKNNGVFFLAILNYFLDEIPSIYSIKFESDTSEDIYYPSDLTNNQND